MKPLCLLVLPSCGVLINIICIGIGYTIIEYRRCSIDSIVNKPARLTYSNHVRSFFRRTGH